MLGTGPSSGETVVSSKTVVGVSGLRRPNSSYGAMEAVNSVCLAC